MPNYCWNRLRVIGPSENIKDVLEHKLDFQHYAPVPSDDQDAYEEAWGTKCGPMDYEVLRQEEFELKVQFRTAWAPPLAFLQKLNRHFPACWFKLEFEVECGWGSGIWIHSLTKRRNSITRVFQWQEPPCYPMEDGSFLLPEDSDEEPTEEVTMAAAEAAEAAAAEAPPLPKKVVKVKK
jgi:hypothetical protein